MQSPQKLRERLQNEHKAFENADTSLQAELAKIGEEIKKSTRNTASASPSKIHRTSQATLPDMNVLEETLSALASKHSTLMANLTGRLDGLGSDINSSLQVSEARAKKLDDLFRVASAENEALYGKFNEELAKLVGKIRGGDGVGELKRRMKESEEENMRLRKENGRLRREVVGLRAQLKD